MNIIFVYCSKFGNVMLIILLPGPEKESKYVILGEKGKVQLLRDSKNSIEMTASELQKNPINYTQVCYY
jgi:hypothetical protein